jgi:hypothetical protein
MKTIAHSLRKSTIQNCITKTQATVLTVSKKKQQFLNSDSEKGREL